MTNFPHTKAALEKYDSTQSDRDFLWENPKSDWDVLHAQNQDQDAIDRVREAFYEDTKDRNSRDNCRVVKLGWLRALVEGLTHEEE